MRSPKSIAAQVQTKKPIPVLHPRLPPAERLLPYLRRIDATRLYANHGPLVSELERRLADHLQLPAHGFVSAASGTAALIGAILASAGRAAPQRPLALLPAFTFVATAVAVENCGYRPYLADIDAESWMLDPRRLAHHPERDRIGLVVPVATFGRPVPQHPWQTFRQQSGIPVVIDGAASFETVAEGPDQFFGPIPTALSFHATKSFATGEGGGIATTDLDLATRAIQALNFGFRGARDSRSSSINGKMSEYHAAVGLAELDGWPAKRAALRAVADCYRRFSDQVGLVDRLVTAPNIGSCYVLFRCAGMQETDRITESLDREGVDFRFWYGDGLHRQTYFAGLPRESLDFTDRLAPHLLGLPVAPDLSDATIARVVSGLAAGI
jgi:dTDP-4-amino-4,6-dideoxygalactose transaminase